VPRSKACRICGQIVENDICPACGVKLDFAGEPVQIVGPNAEKARKVVKPIAGQNSPRGRETHQPIRNPWISGSFYLAVFILILVVLLVAARAVPLAVLPIATASAVAAMLVVAALQLRHDRSLTERGFLTLIRLALRSLTGIDWAFARRLLGYLILPLGLVLTIPALDPRMSIGTRLWVFVVFAAVLFLVSLVMILERKQPLWRIFYHALGISILGFALVCWARYLSALASIVAEASIMIAVALKFLSRRAAIARYGKNRGLIYLAFIMIVLLPSTAIVPHLTDTPTVVVSPSPKSLVLQPGTTRTIDLYVATVHSSAWHIEVTAESPELLVVYLDHKERGPIEIPFLEQGQELNQTLRLQASPLIPNGTYKVEVDIQYRDAIGEIHNGSTNIEVLVGPAPPSPCIIATATFGSEVSPDVDFLRSFRDRLVLSTKAGSAFMQVFNAWYYSFSPFVARAIAASEPLRLTVRAVLYPLLSILRMSASIYSMFSMTPELAILAAGVVASSLIGLVYLTPFTLITFRGFTNRRKRAVSLAMICVRSVSLALLLVGLGEMMGSYVLLASGSSALVLTCVLGVPTIVSLFIIERFEEGLTYLKNLLA